MSSSSSSSSSRKRKLSATSCKETEAPTRQRPAVLPPKEKRAARYRSSASDDILQRIVRALNQRLYLISQEDKSNISSSSSSSPSPPSLSKHFAVLGSTGNVYNVIVDKKPTCTCPGRYCIVLLSQPSFPSHKLNHSPHFLMQYTTIQYHTIPY